jgi:hypothetical protein
MALEIAEDHAAVIRGSVIAGSISEENRSTTSRNESTLDMLTTVIVRGFWGGTRFMKPLANLARKSWVPIDGFALSNDSFV